MSLRRGPAPVARPHQDRRPRLTALRRSRQFDEEMVCKGRASAVRRRPASERPASTSRSRRSVLEPVALGITPSGRTSLSGASCFRPSRENSVRDTANRSAQSRAGRRGRQRVDTGLAQQFARANQRQPDQRGWIVRFDRFKQGDSERLALALQRIVGLLDVQVVLDLGVGQRAESNVDGDDLVRA